jgi:ABC-2 type transport system permease protein
MLPLLVLVHAIGAGARAIAGEEDAGRLELLLAYPVRRRDAVLAKGAAVAASVAVLCAAAGLTMLVLDPVFGLELSLGNLAEAIVGLAVLGLFHGWLALAVGAAIPSRALAIGIPGWLDPFRVLSPFWLVGSSPLQNGVDALGTLAVAAAAVVVLAAGAALLERRDLQTP